MRTGITVNVRAPDRARLEAIVANGNTPQKHMWRAKIVLLTADGHGTAAIMHATGKSKSVVWRWQERFMHVGVEGAKHPRWTFHFTPKACSWLNAVESFFAKLTKKRLKRGVFRSVQDLKDAIHRFMAEANNDPKPFVWTADPQRIIAAVQRGIQKLESIH
jgi:hypothetical protein